MNSSVIPLANVSSYVEDSLVIKTDLHALMWENSMRGLMFYFGGIIFHLVPLTCVDGIWV